MRTYINEYYMYLLDKVGALTGYFRNRSRICAQLFLIEFRWDFTIELDADRAENGKRLRLNYYYDTGRNSGMKGTPCTVLEMLIAMSCAMEDIMGEPGNDHPERWFWDMIDNLGLGDMDDDNFDECVVNDRVANWMSRNYDRNGNGGIFPLRFSKSDQRRVPIWEQAGSYMSERV